MAEGSEKQEQSVYALSATGPSRFDLQGTRTADAVLEQLECHRVSNGEFIEGRAVTHVASVKKNIATVRQADEPVALADEQRDDSTGSGRAAAFRGTLRRVLASRRRSSDSAPRVLAHVVTSGVPTVADANRHRNRRHRHRVLPSDGLR